MAPSYEPQILEEQDDDFDPKTEDIHQYCKIIGLDPSSDPDLVWIAKEGIMAKLPPDWKAVNQEGYGLYYFNFKTGQSIWEHPNDEYYRGKVRQEKSKKKGGVRSSFESDNGSKLNPLKTSISMSSIDDVDDLMRSSNESFGRLGYKKPVLGAESKDDSDYSDESSDNSESAGNNIQMDIGDLTPAKESVKTPPGDHFDIDVSLTESSDVKTPSKSHSQSISKSSSLAGNRFLKKLPVKSDQNSASESTNGVSASKQSYTSVSSSVKKAPSLTPQSTRPKSSRATEIPSISVQIEKKRKEEEAKIEQELREIQLKLQEQRQEKYNQLMEEHDKEIMRIQDSIQELTENQKQESFGELESLKKKFVDDKEKILKEETERHEREMSENLEKIRSDFAQEKLRATENEEKRIRAERLRMEDSADKRFKVKTAEITAEIEANEAERIRLLQTQLTKQKYETQKLQEQDKDLFEKLRKSRHEIEEQHKAELLEMQENHEKQKRQILKSQENEIKRLESNHLDHVSALHKSFEDRLEATKTNLEDKRREFDRRVEKWEADHSTRTMAWASRNLERKNEHERQTLQVSINRQPEVSDMPQNTMNTSKESHGSDQPLTTKELDETAKSQTGQKSRMPEQDESSDRPASLRLQEYLKSLEEKINSFQALSRSSEPDFTSTRKPKAPESRFYSSNDVYSSERWRSYFGEDYKYIPAKSILNDRIMNDYKTKNLRRHPFSTSH
ncbi:Oidioi.mRNA.OKI2018_I69.PAR.g11515.t2.cds [Oikopleura dioica]|uniref:Oidioi.mRNA.OKI2018_I69.PAR.g11515.t2.cds n=1 Tax=Oikopleura dioica TaxID=34765 RepID=A0ABN7RVY0_OIKDI|nr:Oidioi.mRNA.OKI2018_I69.PAR.g11515.t2.cds [Oikopleura dioica]